VAASKDIPAGSASPPERLRVHVIGPWPFVIGTCENGTPQLAVAAATAGPSKLAGITSKAALVASVSPPDVATRE
jgi:hypothetical protein